MIFYCSGCETSAKAELAALTNAHREELAVAKQSTTEAFAQLEDVSTQLIAAVTNNSKYREMLCESEEAMRSAKQDLAASEAAGVELAAQHKSDMETGLLSNS